MNYSLVLNFLFQSVITLYSKHVADAWVNAQILHRGRDGYHRLSLIF